ncbi:MAG: hypothetical protein CMJ27_00610 [Phycisphaerae bacterium]|nr:hypothetical protein [Phycisphaerae bacterium]OUX03262.1 MAG: hypothetical protein CBD91_00490 [Phycisphaeraceae bacterium TMED231]
MEARARSFVATPLVSRGRGWFPLFEHHRIPVRHHGLDRSDAEPGESDSALVSTACTPRCDASRLRAIGSPEDVIE